MLGRRQDAAPLAHHPRGHDRYLLAGCKGKVGDKGRVVGEKDDSEGTSVRDEGRFEECYDGLLRGAVDARFARGGKLLRAHLQL